MNSENICPVCGYEMEAPPKDYRICPSCGTEFGVHDVNASILELRTAWVKAGLKWWSKTDVQPQHWDPLAQLERITKVATVKPAASVYALEIVETQSNAVNVSTGIYSSASSDPLDTISTSNKAEDDVELTLG